MIFAKNSFATTFTTSDLAGTWDMYSHLSSSSEGGWLYGTIVINSSGTLTSGSWTSKGTSSGTDSGTFSTDTVFITSDGKLSTSSGDFVVGTMDSSKTMMSIVFNLSSDLLGSATFIKKSSSLTNTPPTISILEPDGSGDNADSSFTITWTDSDPDDDATITL